MFYIVDRDNNFAQVKSGFKSASQANNWAKKNLPKGTVHLWGTNWSTVMNYRYFIRMR